MTALLIVDVQNDFCSGGALEVKNGETITTVINKIAPKFDFVVASKDWHPEDTIHFEKWPLHCIQGTHGAEFHATLLQENIDLVIHKGTENKDDGYSAFQATNVNLTTYLREKKVTQIYVVGLATEYCIKASAIDSLKNGFKTIIVKDAVKGLNPINEVKTLTYLKAKGCVIKEASEI